MPSAFPNISKIQFEGFGRTIGGIQFGRDAAHMAGVLLQRPFRAAFDAAKLLAKLR